MSVAANSAQEQMLQTKLRSVQHQINQMKDFGYDNFSANLSIWLTTKVYILNVGVSFILIGLY